MVKFHKEVSLTIYNIYHSYSYTCIILRNYNTYPLFSFRIFWGNNSYQLYHSDLKYAKKFLFKSEYNLDRRMKLDHLCVLCSWLLLRHLAVSVVCRVHLLFIYSPHILIYLCPDMPDSINNRCSAATPKHFTISCHQAHGRENPFFGKSIYGYWYTYRTVILYNFSFAKPFFMA